MSEAKPNLPPPRPPESDLPEGWVGTALDQLLVALESGSRPRGGVRGISEGKPSVGGEHLNDEGGFRFDNIKYVPEEFYQRMLRGRIHVGDVLVVKDGATTGKVSLVRPDFPYPEAVVNEHVFVCRPAEGVLPSFLFYYLFSKEGQDCILENFRGSAQGGINQSFATGTPVPLAPLAEQKRIAAKVEELLARVNSARARLSEIPAILERFRQSVLAAACSGQLTAEWREEHAPTETAEGRLCTLAVTREQECCSRQDGARTRRYKPAAVLDADPPSQAPDGWLWCSFEQATSLITKGSSPGWQGFEYQPAGVLFLRSQNVRWGALDLSDRAYLPQRFNDEHPRSVILEGDVLLNLVGASVGRSAVASPQVAGANCNQAVAIIRPLRSEVVPKWVMLYLISPFGQDHIGTTKVDVARANFNLDDIRPMPLPLPPRAEQNEIVRRVEALFDLVDGVEARVRAATVRTDRLSQAVLTRALRGELVAPEAEIAAREGRDYEPAAALLGRIQQARKQDKQPAKRGRGGRKMARRSSRRQPAKRRRRLDEVLHEQGQPLTPERLFELAGFDEDSVDDFYEELRTLVREGKIGEDRPNQKDVYLKAAGT